MSRTSTSRGAPRRCGFPARTTSSSAGAGRRRPASRSFGSRRPAWTGSLPDFADSLEARMRIALGTMMVLLAVGAPAQAQAPINLSVRVTELSQIFTQMYGQEGLVVNSLTPLETGESHSGHFNSGFESEFSQF